MRDTQERERLQAARQPNIMNPYIPRLIVDCKSGATLCRATERVIVPMRRYADRRNLECGSIRYLVAPRAWIGRKDGTTVMVCAWCPDRREAEALAGRCGLDVSHGICPDCAEVERKAIAALAAE